MQKFKRALVLFSSNPKTEAKRKSIGHSSSQSERVQNLLLTHSINTLLDFKKYAEVEIFISLQHANSSIPHIDSNINILNQHGRDFHSRISNTFETLSDKGFDQIVMIGNDTPDINADSINESFDYLEKHNFVLGPSYDGGVYLIGLNEWSPQIFKNVRWLSSNVYYDILLNADKLGYSCKDLVTLSDIDDTVSLKIWATNAVKFSNKLAQLLLQLLNQFTFVSNQYRASNIIINHSKLIWQLPPPIC